MGQTVRQAFEALVSAFNECGVRYAIIGGLAVVQHARPRTTDDIDVLLTVPQMELAGLFQALRERGFDVNIQLNIREFRDECFTSIRFKDVAVDMLQAMIPAYVHVLDRAIIAEILGHRVHVGSAEGLIVTKLIAMRPQDEADIQELLAAYAGRLDLDFIEAELETFTKPDDPRRAKFAAWARQAKPPQG